MSKRTLKECVGCPLPECDVTDLICMERTANLSPLQRLMLICGLGPDSNSGMMEDPSQKVQATMDDDQGMKQAAATGFFLQAVAKRAERSPQEAAQCLEIMLPQVHPSLLPLVEVVRGHIFMMRRTGRRPPQ